MMWVVRLGRPDGIFYARYAALLAIRYKFLLQCYCRKLMWFITHNQADSLLCFYICLEVCFYSNDKIYCCRCYCGVNMKHTHIQIDQKTDMHTAHIMVESTHTKKLKWINMEIVMKLNCRNTMSKRPATDIALNVQLSAATSSLSHMTAFELQIYGIFRWSLFSIQRKRRRRKIWTRLL